jgi:Patatin-like phospholipase
MTAGVVGQQVGERASTAPPAAGEAIATEPSAGLPALDGQPPGGSGIGICCSGGGIRSAAFNLGALQALSAAGIYQRADFVACVSGGSYIAASFATVAHGPRFDGEDAKVVPAQDPHYAYAPQSPEEQRLRNQSHYLFPRLAVTVRGVIWMLFGLLANLGLLLIFVFAGARPLGWALRAFGIVPGLGGPDPRLHLPPGWWVWTPALLGAALGLLFGENLIEVYRRPRTPAVEKLRNVATGLLLASLITGILMLAAPTAAVGLQRLALTNRPDSTTARVIAGIGFATPSGCAAAARERPGGACGATRVPAAGANAAGAGPTDARGVLAFLAALLALIRRMIRLATGATGQLGSKPRADAVAQRGGLLGLVHRVEQRLWPWVGSALVVGVAALLALRWIDDAALRGFGAGEIWLIVGALGLFVVIKTFTDINRSSLHPYYRERLASAYTVRRERRGDTTVAEPVPFEEPLSLTKVAPGANGVDGPRLVICTAANITDESVPPGRGCLSFTFTTEDVGLSDSPLIPRCQDGRKPTLRIPVSDYEQLAGPRRVTLPAAVAVSGAAVSPLAGRMTRPSQRLLLAVGNVRLGLWLRNPMSCPPDKDAAPPDTDAAPPAPPGGRSTWWRKLWTQWQQPGPRLLLLELAGKTHLNRRWLYITDGGHYDNLGLVEALRQEPRPKVLLAFDASGDRVDRWSTLGEAIALARSELGVRVEIDPRRMRAIDSQHVHAPFVRGDIWYPPLDPSQPLDPNRPPDATLWVTKLGVADQAPWDVQAYAQRFPSFPCDPTIQQLYGDEQLEAYRALGQASTELMLAASFAKAARQP